jgi:hypothetical protein
VATAGGVCLCPRGRRLASHRSTPIGAPLRTPATEPLPAPPASVRGFAAATAPLARPRQPSAASPPRQGAPRAPLGCLFRRRGKERARVHVGDCGGGGGVGGGGGGGGGGSSSRGQQQQQRRCHQRRQQQQQLEHGAVSPGAPQRRALPSRAQFIGRPPPQEPG